ncbi:hypothetical protein B0H16DRAFT_1402021 [Mycena metata]|uniref:Uncharacterized protein n=1 Tax=Mycena metata TaxID=1033252 RepID=A0AAD7KGG6_9AGAR|nr:hypothetical protein B0H16DRAFT_1402021 [Mycena metata]
MDQYTGRFRLEPSDPPPGPTTRLAATSPTAPPVPAEDLQLVFRVFPDPTPQKPRQGSFEYDLASSKYPIRWEKFRDFEVWLANEQQAQTIELRLVNTYHISPLYDRQLRYVCSRAGTGGKKEYTKLHPEWNRKIQSKFTDCPCSLIVKQYPGTTVVLGKYSQDHNHPTGNGNLRFVRIPAATREYIAAQVRNKVSPQHILELLHRRVYHFDAVFDCDTPADRSEFIQLSDIRRIAKQIEAESVRFHPDDGLSTLQWIKRLDAKGHLLGFKAKSDPPPPNSGLDADVFTLMIQTNWQRHMFQKYGSALLCIDATHNTTMYNNLNLTTLVVRDKWAHGTSNHSTLDMFSFHLQEFPWPSCLRRMEPRPP